MADDPEFFIDRSLGRRAVPEALQACGLVVHTTAAVYGEQVGQGLRDETWLRRGEIGRRRQLAMRESAADIGRSEHLPPRARGR
jgi:PIN domain-containing protein